LTSYLNPSSCSSSVAYICSTSATTTGNPAITQSRTI
jgi:hypothetical protein